MILFILKRFYDYNGHNQISNGLKTSARFVIDLLHQEGFKAKLVEAIDGNCIDRLVTENKPRRVVLEAIWVTPAKLAELKRLHPHVKWTVRVHSEINFLAQEGCAIGWIFEYLKLGVEVGFNSSQTVEDFKALGKAAYLPNFYPLRKPRPAQCATPVLNVGCFGAIRPLKNQLIQAFAAVEFAKAAGTKMTFHMNGSRIEQNGNNNLKNIQALIAAAGQTLELHPWLDHEDFLELIAKMDIMLQVSNSESFCIVASDAVSMSVPLVGSSAIRWLPKIAQADTGSVKSIVAAIQRTSATTVIMNHAALESYLHEAREVWEAWALS